VVVEEDTDESGCVSSVLASLLAPTLVLLLLPLLGGDGGGAAPLPAGAVAPVGVIPVGFESSLSSRVRTMIVKWG
jgi:hypothetical protein